MARWQSSSSILLYTLLGLQCCAAYLMRRRVSSCIRTVYTAWCCECHSLWEISAMHSPVSSCPSLWSTRTAVLLCICLFFSLKKLQYCLKMLVPYRRVCVCVLALPLNHFVTERRPSSPPYAHPSSSFDIFWVSTQSDKKFWSNSEFSLYRH